MDTTTHTQDHDLLIELRTEVRGMRVDLKELTDNTGKRVEQLENGKVGVVEVTRIKAEHDKLHDDHEGRLRLLEKANEDRSKEIAGILTTIKTWGSVLGIGLTLVQIGLYFIK